MGKLLSAENFKCLDGWKASMKYLVTNLGFIPANVDDKKNGSNNFGCILHIYCW
jgi:hypothetical protein